MISHLVDSDWAIDYLKQHRNAVRLLRPYISTESLAISIIGYAEIYEGIVGGRDRPAAQRVFEDFLAGLTILGLDRATADIFTELRVRLRPTGELLADHDTWIAATAIRYDLALLSRDHAFNRIAELKRG